jgi:hypothetical protein
MSRTGEKEISQVYVKLQSVYNTGQFQPWKREVFMYIDPNTGGMLFQVLAAAFVALSGVLLVFSGKIRQGIASLRRRFRKDKDEDSE